MGASLPHDKAFLPYATYLKHVGTSDVLSPTVGFPTVRQFDRQFLSPPESLGTFVARFFRENSNLCPVEILRNHRGQAQESYFLVATPYFEFSRCLLVLGFC